MTTKTGLERAAYTAVGAPVAGARAVRAATEKIAESIRSRRDGLKARGSRGFRRLVAEGESAVNRTVEWVRSAGMSDEVRGARRTAANQVRTGFSGIANQMEKALDVIEPDLPLREIQGVGPASAAKLHSAGVRGISGLLSRTGDDDAIKRLADDTGISVDRLAEWRLMADLSRVDGIGDRYRQILHSVGVGTLTQLANADARALRDQISATDLPGSPRQLPGESEVAGWIEDARRLSLAGSK